MRPFDENKLHAYREISYGISGPRLTSEEDALVFVEARGLIFFWPVKDVELPSLWTAAAGNRPVHAQHDDPGHVTWGWKDSMLDQKRWYYGKLLRGRATLVSLGLLPHFYALSERVGDPDDYLLAYEQGQLSFEAKSVADALLTHGALHTLELRKRAHLGSRNAKSRFDRALRDLQKGLWILPIGVAEAGAWRYAFIYQLFDRWLPGVLPLARRISRRDARKAILDCYLESVGATELKEIKKLFRWEQRTIEQALRDLADVGRCVERQEGAWLSTALEGYLQGNSLRVRSQSSRYPNTQNKD